MNENVWPLILLGGGLLAFLLLVSFLSKNYSLNNFKNKTVGDGQHGTARWATPKEIPHDLSCSSVSPVPLAQGRRSSCGAGHHPRQYGRQKAQSQKRCDFANYSQAAGEAPPSYSGKKRTAKAEEKENGNFQNQKCRGRSAGCPRAGGQR